MYQSYTSKKQGGEPSEEALGISSTYPRDPVNTTQLSSIISTCVGVKSLGTHPRTCGTLLGQQDQTTGVTYSKTK